LKLLYNLVPEVTESNSLNQTHFTVEAIPSRRGRPRRTRDMAEVFVCICGTRVEENEQVMGSKTALRCKYDGCETSWVCTMPIVRLRKQFHLACFNFTCAPKKWRYENDTRSEKRARVG
jgi:hypothetical protein